MRRREALRVVANESVGPYSLIRVERGSLDPGSPGQFFMLEAPGRPLPRPMSLCQAPPVELGFLLESIGPGTRALAAVEPREKIHVFGPLGNGYRLDVERPLLVGGGIGVAPFPYLSAVLGSPPALGQAQRQSRRPDSQNDADDGDDPGQPLRERSGQRLARSHHQGQHAVSERDPERRPLSANRQMAETRDQEAARTLQGA